MNAKMVIAPANVESFKSIFNSINTIVDTITFECYPDRVEINTLDKSKTTFISCVMDSRYFDEYSCDEPDRFNIDTTEFRKIIKSCKDDLTVEFDNECIHIHSTTKRFKLYQVNDDLASPKPPSLDYAIRFNIPFKHLKEVVKDIELFAKDITIKTSNNQVNFTSSGTAGEYCDTYTVDSDLSPKIVKLSTEKLLTCLGSNKVSDEIEVHIETDMPFLMYQKAEGICMMYMIAPMIDVSD